jgi:hypothetical protein
VRVVGVEEEIDVTVRKGFPPGERTEQMEPNDAGPMKIGFMARSI